VRPLDGLMWLMQPEAQITARGLLAVSVGCEMSTWHIERLTLCGKMKQIVVVGHVE